ncbi:MAG: hypothetical protein A2X13_02110 [Bacteroidetes bacterium GWC2_33_15]|nr:MAG: hypothetical protein A2X10_07515 [Bacteroidetes bacterium GWA2_33_15]OFX52272.1 MAG: hypothetical protein A2X13_02110 [Bacteroidetes bacterium GWC2_33_15]OFX64426.1 MAG: hypothetical protein A2X15_12930 [Bacteroidetes bacterium GWB2_32_14]OFX67831.1 MAG: hypothetical protein A2X14_06755 [Bacteroidetes bacterium GWD2_33_33]HAN19447.1 hypothetical protein [Bacteroidales bacterium]
MEPFSINLHEMTNKGTRYKRLLIILTLFFLAVSVLTFWLLSRYDNTNIWFFLGLGIYFLLYIYFGFVGYNSKMFINSDEYALEYQFGFFSKVPDKIIWETITKVKLGFTCITFYKRTGKRKVMEIGWLPYTKVKEIKNKINCFCTEKGIAVEVAEYHKEEAEEEKN